MATIPFAFVSVLHATGEALDGNYRVRLNCTVERTIIIIIVIFYLFHDIRYKSLSFSFVTTLNLTNTRSEFVDRKHLLQFDMI